MADLPMVKAHDSVGEYQLAPDPINLFLPAHDHEQQAIPFIFYLPELLVCSAFD